MLIVSTKQVRDRVRVTQDNVRYFDAIMRADNGHGIAYVQTLDQRPYMDMLLDAGVFFTAPYLDYRPDVARNCDRADCAVGGNGPCGHCEP